MKTQRIACLTYHKFPSEDWPEEAFAPCEMRLASGEGAFAEFERAVIRERQREGIVLAKQRGVYHGRKRSLSLEQVAFLKQRVAVGEQKARLAREFGISRETLYQYLRASANPQEVCDEQ